MAVHIIQRLPYGIKVGEHAREVGEHARELFNHHGVGYQPCNNGLLLLLAVGDRKSAIRTGKGTQRVVTDDMVSDMLDATEFKRKLRAHDYAGGVQYILDLDRQPASAKPTNDALQRTTCTTSLDEGGVLGIGAQCFLPFLVPSCRSLC